MVVTERHKGLHETMNIPFAAEHQFNWPLLECIVVSEGSWQAIKVANAVRHRDSLS